MRVYFSAMVEEDFMYLHGFRVLKHEQQQENLRCDFDHLSCEAVAGFLQNSGRVLEIKRRIYEVLEDRGGENSRNNISGECT